MTTRARSSTVANRNRFLSRNNFHRAFREGLKMAVNERIRLSDKIAGKIIELYLINRKSENHVTPNMNMIIGRWIAIPLVGNSVKLWG